MVCRRLVSKSCGNTFRVTGVFSTNYRWFCIKATNMHNDARILKRAAAEDVMEGIRRLLCTDFHFPHPLISLRHPLEICLIARQTPKLLFWSSSSEMCWGRAPSPEPGSERRTLIGAEYVTFERSDRGSLTILDEAARRFSECVRLSFDLRARSTWKLFRLRTTVFLRSRVGSTVGLIAYHGWTGFQGRSSGAVPREGVPRNELHGGQKRV